MRGRVCVGDNTVFVCHWPCYGVWLHSCVVLCVYCSSFVLIDLLKGHFGFLRGSILLVIVIHRSIYLLSTYNLTIHCITIAWHFYFLPHRFYIVCSTGIHFRLCKVLKPFIFTEFVESFSLFSRDFCCAAVEYACIRCAKSCRAYSRALHVYTIIRSILVVNCFFTFENVQILLHDVYIVYCCNKVRSLNDYRCILTFQVCLTSPNWVWIFSPNLSNFNVQNQKWYLIFLKSGVNIFPEFGRFQYPKV